MSGWFATKKKSASFTEKKGSPMQFQRSGSFERTLIQGAGELRLEGDSHGLYNPLAWENMPSVLQQKFPHWKDSTPLMKSSPKDRDGYGAEDHCFQFSSSFKQPAHSIPYVVMECDTLNGIALKFDTTPSELARLNKKPPGLSFQLLPGEVLYVPDGELPEPCNSASHSGDLESSHESQETLKSTSRSREASVEKPRDRVLSVSSGCGLFQLSSEWYTGTKEEVTDSHISISAKYMTNDQGCVHGTLTLSNTVLLFQPHTGDPLVKEAGKEAFELAIPLQDISYAALTRECRPPRRKSQTAAGAPPPSNTTLTEDSRDQQPFAEPADPHGNSNASSTNGNSPSRNGENLLSTGSLEGGAVVENGIRMSQLLRSGESETGETVPKTQTKDPEEELVNSSLENKEGSPQVSNSVSEIIAVDAQRTECEGDDASAYPETKSVFDVEQSDPDNHEEMLAIMGATVPSTKQSDSANESDDHCGEEDCASGDSPLLDNPRFLHVRVTPLSGATHTYTPLSSRGIEIPHDQTQRANSPVYQVRTAFCFAIREKRSSDVAKFLATHHPQALGGRGSPSDQQSWSEGSYEIVTTDSLDVDLAFHDDHYPEESSSWEVYSLKDVSRFRSRIERMEVEASLPLPTLSEDSNLMQEKHLQSLSQQLACHAVGNNWYLIYSTFKHGISLRTMYRSMMGYGRDSPVLLLVRDESKKLFGALLSCPLRISDHFYGTGDSFLFSFHEPDDELKVHLWSGDNHYIIKGNSDSIGIGSGDGHFGLWLDEYFYHGSSYSCSTFNNECLAGKEDFICSGVEAWGFVPSECS